MAIIDIIFLNPRHTVAQISAVQRGSSMLPILLGKDTTSERYENTSITYPVDKSSRQAINAQQGVFGSPSVLIGTQPTPVKSGQENYNRPPYRPAYRTYLETINQIPNFVLTSAPLPPGKQLTTQERLIGLNTIINKQYSAIFAKNIWLESMRLYPTQTDTYGALIQSESGKIAYWRMNDVPSAIPTVATFFDYSGYALNVKASYTGSTSANVFFDTNGPIVGNNITGGLKNDSSGLTIIKVAVAGTEKASPLQSLGDVMSIESWVNLSNIDAASGHDSVIVSRFSNSGLTGPSSFTLAIKAGTHVVNFGQTHLTSTEAYDTIASSTISLTGTDSHTQGTANHWHHVVATKNGSNVHIYIDGVDVTGSVSNLTLADDDTADKMNFSVALGQLGLSPIWVSEIALYNIELTSAQVFNHYTVGAGILLPTPKPATELPVDYAIKTNRSKLEPSLIMWQQNTIIYDAHIATTLNPGVSYDLPPWEPLSKTYLEFWQQNNIVIQNPTFQSQSFIGAGFDNPPRDYSRPVQDFINTSIIVLSTINSVTGKQSYDLPRPYYGRVAHTWINQTPQTFVSVPGRQDIHLPPKGYPRFVQDEAFIVQNFVLTSTPPPSGKQETNLLGYNLPRINKYRTSIDAQENISITPQRFVSVIGQQFLHLPPRGYQRPVQDWIWQFQGYVLTSAAPPIGKQIYNLAPNGYKLPVQDWITISQPAVISIPPVGKQVYDLAPRGLHSRTYLEIIQQPTYEEQLETLPSGIQTYVVPNQPAYRFYCEASDIYQVPNFVLTSAAPPTGKQETDLLGYDVIRVNKYRISIDSQANIHITQQSFVTVVGSQYTVNPEFNVRARRQYKVSIEAQSINIPPQTFVSVIGRQFYDLPVLPILAKPDYQASSRQDLLVSQPPPSGKQEYDLLGYDQNRVNKYRIAIGTMDVLCSPVPVITTVPVVLPNGQQETELLGYAIVRVNKLYRAIESQSEILQVPNFVLTSAAEPNGKQEYDLLGYNIPRNNQYRTAIDAQSNISQTPQFFTPTVGIQIYELPPRGYARPVQDHVNQTLQTFVSVIGRQVYDLAPRAYPRPVQDWVNQTPQTFESVAGIQTYNLPNYPLSRFYTVESTDIYQVPNFVLTSAGIPNGKIETELLGYNIPRIIQYRTAIDSQANISITPASFTPVIGNQYYDLPPTKPLDSIQQHIAIRTQSDIVIPTYEVELETLPAGNQLTDSNLTDGYPRLISINNIVLISNNSQQWVTDVPIWVLTTPDAQVMSRYYDLPIWPLSRFYTIESNDIYQVPNFVLTSSGEPNGKQLTTDILPGSDELRFVKSRIAIISTDKLGMPVIIANSVVTTSTAGKQETDLLGYDQKRVAQFIRAIASQIEISQSPQYLLVSPTNLVGGAQETELLGYDLIKLRGYLIATRTQSDIVQSPQYVLTSAPPPNGKTSLDVPIGTAYKNIRATYTIAIEAQSDLLIVRGIFVTVIGAQSYNLPPYRPASEPWLEPQYQYIVETELVVLPPGQQVYDLPVRAIFRNHAVESQSEIYQVPQTFESVAGKQIYDLPPYRPASRTYLEYEPYPFGEEILNVTPTGRSSTDLPVIDNNRNARFISIRAQENINQTPQGFVSVYGKQSTDLLPYRPLVRPWLEVQAQFVTEEQIETEVPGQQIYDNPVIAFNRRSAIEAQLDVYQVPQTFESVDGKHSFDLPVIGLKSRTYLELVQQPFYQEILNTLPTGKESIDLPVIGITRASAINAQSNISQTPQRFVTVPGKESIELPPYRNNSRPWLDVQNQYNKETATVVSLPGKSIYDNPVRPINNRYAVESQLNIKQTPQEFKSVIGKQYTELPVISLKSRTYLEVQVYPFTSEILNVVPTGHQSTELLVIDYGKNQKFISIRAQIEISQTPQGFVTVVGSQYTELPVIGKKSRTYLESIFLPIYEEELSTLTVGNQIYDNPVIAFNRRHAIESQIEVYQVPQTFESVTGSQYTELPPIGLKSKTYLETEPLYIITVRSTPFGRSTYELPVIEKSRFIAVTAQNNISQTPQGFVRVVGKQYTELPVYKKENRSYLELILQPTFEEQLETLPSGTSIYDLAPRGLSSKTYLEVIQQSIAPRHTIPVGKSVYELPVIGKSSFVAITAQAYIVQTQQTFVTIIGKTAYELPLRGKTAEPWSELIDQSLVLQFYVIPNGKSFYEIPVVDYTKNLKYIAITGQISRGIIELILVPPLYAPLVTNGVTSTRVIYGDDTETTLSNSGETSTVITNDDTETTMNNDPTLATNTNKGETDTIIR